MDLLPRTLSVDGWIGQRGHTVVQRSPSEARGKCGEAELKMGSLAFRILIPEESKSSEDFGLHTAIPPDSLLRGNTSSHFDSGGWRV